MTIDGLGAHQPQSIRDYEQGGSGVGEDSHSEAALTGEGEDEAEGFHRDSETYIELDTADGATA